MRLVPHWLIFLLLLPTACVTKVDPVEPGLGGRIVLPSANQGGQGGSAAGQGGGENAGEAGQGGDAGTAGDGGSAGDGGDAGIGGEGGTAGTAGIAGTAGTAETGGSAGGGAGGADAGAGGSAGTSIQPTDPEDKAATLAHLVTACDHPLDDTFYAAATPPNPWSTTERGSIVRCGYDRLIPLQEIQDHLTEQGGSEVPVFTAVHRLRTVYWTEDSFGKPILTSATFFLPEQRLAKGSAPLVVLAHGSVGVADKCAPSRESPEGFHKDWRTLAYKLAGRGWVALMPDYPGLGTPGAHAWMLSTEEGHSLLDATRAARKLTKPGFLSSKNMIIGHSQGGHAAISAQALHGAYGAEGDLAAVLAYAPVWFSQASWGALMTSTAVSLKLNSASALASSVIYFAGHTAQLDGEDKVSELFLPDRESDIRNFLLGQCWQDITNPEKWPASLQPALAPSPGKGGGELYAQLYTSKVGTCGLTGSCSDPLAATWRQRWANDRPPPDTKIPLVIWGGDLDASVVPGRLQCGLDRLKAQGAPLSACAAKGAAHSDILVKTHAWVEEYLRWKLLDALPPAACPNYETEIPVKCATPPTNSLKPEDP
ncbi:MAG: lipase family protein [Myxococcales bacterium]|nr:lipase family protein [Polyangiaceae bacterium]MDW8248779.1 lipase family protein [Myxococcales bacterium]